MYKLTIFAIILALGVCLSQAAPADSELREKRSPEPHGHRNKEVIKVKVYERTPHGIIKHKYKFRNYGGGQHLGLGSYGGGGGGGGGNAGASSHATAFSHTGPFGSISHSSASATANAGSSFYR